MAGDGRPNTELAAAVDQALALAEKQGVRAAAAFLTARGAGFALTCRVLADPERRQRCNSPADQPVQFCTRSIGLRKIVQSD